MSIKLLLYAILCFALSLLAALFLGTAFQSLSLNLLSIMQVIVTVFAALSFVFFTYTDNIDQKLADLYKRYHEEKIDRAHESIASLKKELLYNAFFILGLLVLEKLLGGLSTEEYLIVLYSYNIEANSVVYSFRMSLFLLAALVFADQARAFTTAIEYRLIVSKGVGKQ